MMYGQFLKCYKVTDRIDSAEDEANLAVVSEDLVRTVSELGGKTFNYGIYRVLTPSRIETMSKIISDAFPNYKNKIVCFGVDWLGRCFAIEKENSSQALLFDVGVGEVIIIPTDIVKFHNYKLINHASDALASEFYEQWREINKKPIKLSQCVGLKIPLFLGGSDTIDNLEIIDLEVYIEICGQLMNKVLSLPEGTTIKEIIIKK